MALFRAPRHAHDDLIDIEGRPVRLRVDGRARRVSLRVDVAQRQVVATAPTPRRLVEAVAFARSRTAWIVQKLDALPQGEAFSPGQMLQLQGQACRLERAAMRIKPRLVPATPEEPMRLIASGDGEAYAAAVLRALKTEALRQLTERTVVHAAALQRPLPSVAVTDAKARWGSCVPADKTGPGRIRYSWRLLMAPPEVLDYVAAHECAHLIEANHSDRFWAVVHRLYGDHTRARAWLKAHGARLHAVGR